MNRFWWTGGRRAGTYGSGGVFQSKDLRDDPGEMREPGVPGSLAGGKGSKNEKLVSWIGTLPSGVTESKGDGIPSGGRQKKERAGARKGTTLKKSPL